MGCEYLYMYMFFIWSVMSVCIKTRDPINDVFWTVFVYLRVCVHSATAYFATREVTKSELIYQWW